MPRSNVVITGTGVVSSIGIGSDAFFQALLEGRSGITSLANRTDEGARPGPDSKPAGLWIGGPIVDFDPKLYVRPRKALKVMCREIQTCFAASQLAIEQAGLADMVPADAGGLLRPMDIGTVFGSEMFYGPPPEMEDAIAPCLQETGGVDEKIFGTVAMKKIMPLWMLKYLPNMPACHVGIALNARGPNNTLVVGDVSGPAAMIEAASCIERGIAKVVVSGATGTVINTTRMNYRNDLPIPDVADPLEASSRPHDPESKGVVGGEGAAAVILENADHASARGAQPLARLVSYAMRFVPSRGMTRGVRTCDVATPGIRGSEAAIRSSIEAALVDAEIRPQQVALVVGHGSGDPVIDAAESAALRATVPGIPVTATIAAIGHCGAACGTIDAVTGALAAARRIAPPTIHSSSAVTVPFLSEPAKLKGDYVLCLSHTSEGNAIATILAPL